MNNYHVCLVCLGSNTDGIYHLRIAQDALTHFFINVAMGTPIETKAEGGISQADYWNQAARFETNLDSNSVINLLKQIERENGRTPNDKLHGCVPLDIDLLTYDDQILRPFDLQKNYVQCAMKSLPDIL